jgi:hypothetical protein
MQEKGWVRETFAEGQEAAFKAIRDRSQARYEKDKIEVLKQFGAEVEEEASDSPPPPPPPAAPNATPPPPTATSQGGSDDSEFEGMIAGESDSECEATEEEEWEDSGEQGDWEVEEWDENEEDGWDSPNDVADKQKFLRDVSKFIQDGVNRSIATFEQSPRKS